VEPDVLEAKVHWNQKMSFTGVAPSGFPLALDAGPDVGGEGQGLRPMELIALGLAGCTAMDVISILAKKRQRVKGFEVLFSGERAPEHPKVFTKIHLEYVVSGINVDPEAVERAIQLSEEKYCPAQAMLRCSVEIEHGVTILESA
jgi:putative redox protein